MSTSTCPCGVGRPYADHCGRIHAGAPAITAEDLMRSRYSAHALRELSYLEQSWHPETCPDVIAPDPGLTWTGLEIRQTERGGALDTDGTVEFAATFERNGEPGTLHEVSRFERLAMRWVYVDGIYPI